jgi:hypothetical protein
MRQHKLAAAVDAALVALLAGCATAGMHPSVPESIKAPATQALSLEAQATGVQIYTCGPSKSDPAKFEWVFKAPEAELFDNSGKKIGKHYAGPTWESNDGSKVAGDVAARDAGPDAGAIPWLLLSAKSNSGSGVFGRVLSIQRVNTVGGKAPVDGCSQAQSGKEARVPYKATYYFFTAAPAASAGSTRSY